MILVDTSVWIDHLRRHNPDLATVLAQGLVLIHPFVSGELSCGNLKNRAEFLNNLRTLPGVSPALDGEVIQFVERHRLWVKGVGWIDVHLLASALITNCRFWTLDTRLEGIAAEVKVRLWPPERTPPVDRLFSKDVQSG